MSMQTASANGADEPVVEMNTTPLIDVMLVLLIMFIITIPIQTHAVKVDLPTADGGAVNPSKNRIVVDSAGRVFWNDAAVDLPTLTQYLELTKRLLRTPELHLQPHPDARYERVDEVLAVTKRVGVEKMGFVGNEQYRRF